jgi:uncharacterized membrane protein
MGVTRINRRSFLAEMRSLLAFMEADDRERILRFYEKLFDQAGEEGEATLLKKLGSPVRQVLQVEKIYRDKQKEEELSLIDTPVEKAAPAAEETADKAEETAEEPAPAAAEMSFAVPSEEGAVDFSAEDEEEELPAAAEEEPAVAEEAVEPAAEEEAVEDTVTEEDEAEEEDEGVTEVVAPPDETESDGEEVEGEESATEESEEEEPKAEEKKEPVGAGRVVAAVFVTLPVILMVVLGFAIALSLGFGSMGVGAVFGAAGGYLSGYAFGGITTFLPDILLLSGGMLLGFCLALFFLWLGIWIAVGGVRLTIRGVAAIYRGILKRGGQSHE